ncbi:MAG: FKBP-type peptidyl-prolyl cis-trans isomerase [Byssovorax sp.]
MKRLALSAVLTLTACSAAPPPPADLPPVAHEATVAADAPKPPSVVAATASGASEASEAAPPDLPAPPDVAAPPADTVKTASGLATRVLVPGTGKDHPGPDDRVEVHYSGWTASGRMFDSSVVRKEPIKLGVKEVIRGWTEGLQLMVVGEKRRMWIPAELAYGQHPREQGAPAGQLTFDVELLAISAAPKAPPVPKDVKSPPKTAKKTRSGLAYRVLKKGPSTGPFPTTSSRVKVDYTGWTTDGIRFDSSVVRGQPIFFNVNQVIKGWTEGLQLMKVGDSFRFWIPATLAYGVKPEREGVPAGMLVFDVDLLGVEPSKSSEMGE